MYNSGWIGEILGFYWKSKIGLLTAEDEAKIASVPGLLAHGRHVLTGLEAKYGEGLPAIVEAWQCEARDGNRCMRRRLDALSRKHGNLTLTKHNGDEALIRLFLACLQVSAWRTEITDGPGTAKRDRLNDDPPEKFSNVYRALKQIGNKGDLKPLNMPARSNTMARELFFLIRNLITNDPGAKGFTGPEAQIDVEKVENAWRHQVAKRRGPRFCDDEAFTAMAIKGFREVYETAADGGNAAFLEEVRGPFWRQLHL